MRSPGKMGRVLQSVAGVGLLAAVLLARGDDKGAFAKRLQGAAELSSLDDPAIKPWHLKLGVQLYNDKGQVSETGTIEEWWTPDRDKRVYTTASYSATEIRDGNSIFRTMGAENVPYLLDEMLRDVVHPVVPGDVIAKSELESKVVSFGATKLDCIMLKKPGTSNFPIVGMVQTYCLNQANDQLRASWLDPEVLTVNSTGMFQGKTVAVTSSIAVFRQQAISEHVEALGGFTPDDTLFAHENGFEDRTSGPIWLSPAAAEASSIRKVPPSYPVQAKTMHISGTVLMEATIGKDGHVETLKEIGHSDARLASAALDAVKEWVYKPHVVNGTAAEVQTRIKVTFNFGPG